MCADDGIEMSKGERMLSYALLSLITSKRVAWAPIGEGQEYVVDAALEESSEAEPEEDGENKDGLVSPTTTERGKRQKGVVNEDGAWCWREGCEGMAGQCSAQMYRALTLSAQNVWT
jgi:sorting nexin-9/18/33